MREPRSPTAALLSSPSTGPARRFGVAFALSLLVHAGLIGAGSWLLSQRGAPAGAKEAIFSIRLAPAPDASSVAQRSTTPVATTPEAKPHAPRSEAPAQANHQARAIAADRITRRATEPTAALAADAVTRITQQPLKPPTEASATPVQRGLAATRAVGEPAQARGASAQAREGFVSLHVFDWLAQHRNYPRAARRAGIEGTVHVRFVIDAQGRIGASAIERSSGARVLDRAALALLEAASPVPGLEQFGLDRGLELRLPIHYQLRPARAG